MNHPHADPRGPRSFGSAARRPQLSFGPHNCPPPGGPPRRCRGLALRGSPSHFPLRPLLHAGPRGEEGGAQDLHVSRGTRGRGGAPLRPRVLNPAPPALSTASPRSGGNASWPEAPEPTLASGPQNVARPAPVLFRKAAATTEPASAPSDRARRRAPPSPRVCGAGIPDRASPSRVRRRAGGGASPSRLSRGSERRRGPDPRGAGRRGSRAPWRAGSIRARSSDPVPAMSSHTGLLTPGQQEVATEEKTIAPSPYNKRLE
ncbi:uncharacterized protein LOC106510524 [Sus scrofa]|uniref:uncharacterized protein LOC106510524 n=1 Tax=Sus scrofa TaxID=9823 RepID=UPI0006B151B4|nr:uncharacterized protein LOC106510524 [Sus scrofa]